MDPKKLLARFTSEAGELIDFLENPDAPLANQLPPQLIEEIERLEKQLREMHDQTKEIFQKANIDIQQLKKEALESSNLSPRDQRLFERAEQVKDHASNTQKALAQAIKNEGPTHKSSKAKKKHKPEKDKKDRRKLFKPLGEDKNWIPL